MRLKEELGPVESQVNKLEIWSWAFYDFANSAFATSVSAVIFNVYFVQRVVGPEGAEVFGLRLTGTALWSFAVSCSMLVVLISAPLLGAVADLSAGKKRFLFLFCYGGVVSTFLLYWSGPGAIWWATFFYILANIGMEGSLPFYDAFLLDLAPREKMGRLSGLGWAAGYVGGVLCLILNLAMIQQPESFALSPDNDVPIRASLVVVALWWGLFAVPIFLFVRERTVTTQNEQKTSYLRTGFRRLIKTLRNVRQYPQLTRFLIAYLLYNDGIQTVIVMAAVFGATDLNMGTNELILCLIFIQIVAFLGALLFGLLADRIANKISIQITLVVWIGAVTYAYFITESWQFWILGGFVGLVLGGSQSASRSLFGQFTPYQNSAEFFGFFATTQKSSSVLGPAVFGLAVALTGTTRYAIVSIGIFFVLGLLVLQLVDEEEGIRESQLAIEV